MASKFLKKRNYSFSKESFFSGHQSRSLVVIFLFLVLSLSGCVNLSDPEASQVYTADTIAVLDANSEISQSFISRRSGLNGITLWLTHVRTQDENISPGAQNYLNINLYLGSKPTSQVFSSTIIIPNSGNNQPITIKIPDQHNLPGQKYYLSLTKDEGSVEVNGRNEDAYPYGKAFINGTPTGGDIAFRLSYDYGFSTLLEDIANLIPKLWVVLPLFIVLLLPGWLILDFAGIRTYFDFGEQTAMSLGLSLVCIPLLMLWTTLLKIKWTTRVVLFVAGFLLALLLFRVIFTFYVKLKKPINPAINPPSGQSFLILHRQSSISWNSVLLILIFLSTLAVRLIMVRDLATPAWVDSVHHALLTRLIMQAGGYPSTYLPYLDISPSAYHPGFHSIAASFTFLSNLDLAQSLIILGQVLNALSIFSVYLFTTIFTQNRTAGLIGAVITGLVSPMPAYYTSWGRYTELTGLLVLPIILALLVLWLQGRKNVKNGLVILLGAITLGGLFMIHYRVVAFLVALLISFAFLFFLTRHAQNEKIFRQLLRIITSMSILGMIFVLPWLLQTLKTTVLPIAQTPISTPIAFFQDFSWPYLTSGLGKQSLVIAGLGLIWSLIKRERFTFILLLWVFIMFFLANMVALKIPGGGLISNASVEIMLFIPISIWAGYFLSQLLGYWKTILPRILLTPSIAMFVLSLSLFAYNGARQLIPILNPVTILSRNADLPAIQWLSEHIPVDETIVINPFAWGYGLYGGSDGGYWISPLSGRLTIPPPVLYGLGKAAPQITQVSQEMISKSSDPSSFRTLLLVNEWHYVFIGAKGGVIPPEKLLSSGLFNLIYYQSGVWIFSIKP